MGYINNIIALMGGIETLIGVIVGVATAAIVGYQKLKKLWAQRELLTDITPLITQAEEHPQQLLQQLVNKPFLDTPLAANTNEGKNSLVTQALIERNPSLLKKAKLTDALSVANWVSSVYQIVKPIIKGIKR
jgi:hypothetical protein